MLDKILQSIENSTAIVISVFVITLVSFLLYQVARRGLTLMLKNGKVDAPLVSTLRVLLRWTFFVVTLLLILQQVGLLQNVWAALLATIATVAIGFVAGWSILSNVFCTILILIYRPFRIGDIVELPTSDIKGNMIKGEVIDLNFMYTSLKNERNEIIQVPNNTFFLQPTVRTPGNQSVSLYEQLKSETSADKE